jgi:serine phosphatase RsbU (regulator of sigma subunit)
MLKIDSNNLKRHKKYLFLVIEIIFSHLIAFGQQSKIDSLASVLLKGKEDSNKVKALNSIAYELRNNATPDSCIHLSKKALSLSEKIKWDIGIGESYSNLQWFYMLKADFATSLNYGFKTLDFWINLSHEKDNLNKDFIEKKISSAYAAIGSVYDDMGDKKALQYYSIAIEREEKSSDKNALSVHYGYMGNFYHNQLNNYNKALYYYSKALVYCEELGQENRASFWLGNTGTILVTLAKEKGINAYKRDSLLDGAMSYFLRALKITEKIKNKRWQAALLNNIGSLLTSRGKYKEAEKYLITSLSISKEINNLTNIIEAEKALSDLYDLTGETQLAFDHFKNFIAASDSLKSDENAKSLTLIETRYVQDKKDIQIAEDKRRQKITIYSVSAGLILVLLLTIFIFRSYQQKQKSNLLLSEKNKIIEEKNKNITDSIEYALRIQTAILPSQKTVNQYLENSFILYKPKGIVAGDFYWMESVGDAVLFAACDCTGHGVPGAMVSVICHNALNRAVREFGLTQPAKILDKTAEIVLENFSKSEDEIHDGMDISICALNTKTKTLEWAGANNSLLLINHEQLTETKADKQCIGYNDNVKPFTNHQFNLQPNTSIYLFTDGYADQFGGPRQRKLTKSKFKDLLVSIQHLPIQQQATELDEFIVNYKKDTEQTDDILVIGVRVSS